MRRLPLVFTASAILVAALIALAAWRTFAKLQNEPTPAHLLADALPPESSADFAAAQPIIDELRHRHGSVLDGTSLATGADSKLPDTSYVELLRREARRLDSLAADHEESRQYDQADSARAEAAALWSLAREKAAVEEPRFTFGGQPVNR
jgi:hypothetical protein